MITAWFAQPAVARWWNQPVTLAEVTAKYQPRISGREPTQMWIIEIDGAAAGLGQTYRHVDYPEHDAAILERSVLWVGGHYISVAKEPTPCADFIVADTETPAGILFAAGAISVRGARGSYTPQPPPSHPEVQAMTEQYEPIDPYANPIDDDTAAAMVAESKALYEIVQDASKWDGYIEEQVDDLRFAHELLGLDPPTAAEEAQRRAEAREFLEIELDEPLRSAYWIPVEFW